MVLDKLLGRFGDAHLIGQHELALANLLEERRSRVLDEWKVRVDQDVQDHAQRPNISRFSLVGAIQDVGADISRRSSLIEKHLVVGAEELAEAKVGQRHATRLQVDQKVLQL